VTHLCEKNRNPRGKPFLHKLLAIGCDVLTKKSTTGGEDQDKLVEASMLAIASFAYSSACSYAACATPTAPIAVPGRVKSSVAIAILKPSPSSPSRFSAGTRTSWSANADVSVARWPIFSRCFSIATPGVPISTTNADIPRRPAEGSVFANTTAHSA
jgi:hypothetical protein